MLLEPQLGFAPPGGSDASAEAVGEKLLPGRLVLEQIEDPRLGWNCVDAQGLLKKCLEFALTVVFLEGADASEYAVAERHARLAARFDLDLGSDEEQLSAETPTPLQGGDALERILDHVDDVAELDDIGFLHRMVGAEDRIPASARDPLRFKQLYVAAVPAAVIENRRLRLDEPITQRTLRRSGEVTTLQSCC